jgi:Protein of unknown function (DUF1097)
MNSLTALSLSIGVLAGLATYLAVGPLSGIFLIWAATIAWAGFFAFGGNKEALTKTMECGIFGVCMAWLTAIQITNIPPTAVLGFPLMAAIAVTVSVIVTCLAANIPRLSTIPGSVLGYSSTFAYLLQTPDKMTKDVLLSFSFNNPLIIISVSIVVGCYFGLYSAKLAERWTKK